jgi:hypothetical protein
LKTIPGKKRGLHTGRMETGEHYAQIKDEVLRSEAFKALPDFAVRVLIAHAAAFRGSNNGSLAITASQAGDYGIKPWCLYAGLKACELTGLLVRTRQGMKSGGGLITNWFALTWRRINEPREGGSYDPGIVATVKEPNDWVRWKRTDDWTEIVRALVRKHRGKSGSERKKKIPVPRQAGATWGRFTHDRQVWHGPIAPDRRVREAPPVAPDRQVTSQRLALSGDRAA